MSISPKLSNSRPSAGAGVAGSAGTRRTRQAPDVIRRLMRQYEHQLKFVVDQPEDCPEIEDFLGRFPEIDRRRVLLMPQGIDQSTLEAKRPGCAGSRAAEGLQFCPRLHIAWYGFARRT